MSELVYSETSPDVWNLSNIMKPFKLIDMNLAKYDFNRSPVDMKNDIYQKINDGLKGSAKPVQIEIWFDYSAGMDNTSFQSPAQKGWKAKTLIMVENQEEFNRYVTNLAMSLSNEQLKQYGVPYTKEEIYRMQQTGGLDFGITLGLLVLVGLIALILAILVIGFYLVSQTVSNVLSSPAGQVILWIAIAGLGIYVTSYGYKVYKETRGKQKFKQKKKKEGWF